MGIRRVVGNGSSHLKAALLATVMLALLAGPVSARSATPRGFLQPDARLDGSTLTDLATAYTVWAFGTAADVNPLLAGRCEKSTFDPKIWFLPVSLGGEYSATCSVPVGAALVVTPGFYECSTVEGDPFHGSNEAELRACAQGGFELMTNPDVSFDGHDVSNLAPYALTTHMATLPANNLLSADSGQTVSTGYFLVTAPLSRGTHTIHTYDQFVTFNQYAGITYTIVVG